VSLAEQFAVSGSDIVTWQGRTVRAVLRMQVDGGDLLRVSRLTVNRERPQALKLAIDGGELEVSGTRAESIALWSTTAPRDVTIDIHADAPTTVDIWNGWSYGGVDQAWVGNAGLVAQPVDGGYTVQCSDGVGAVDFTDLVVRVDHVKR